MFQDRCGGIGVVTFCGESGALLEQRMYECLCKTAEGRKIGGSDIGDFAFGFVWFDESAVDGLAVSGMAQDCLRQVGTKYFLWDGQRTDRLMGIAVIVVQQFTAGGTMENPYIMPSYLYADVVCEFEDEVYAFQREHPEFQLNHYHDVLLLEGIRWDMKSMSEADVSQMNGQTVMALILGAIRAERFCTGAMNDFFESGCIEKWLRRLEALANES